MAADPKLYPNAKLILRPSVFVSEFCNLQIDNHLLALDQDRQIIPDTYLGLVDPSALSASKESFQIDKTYDSGFLFYANTWTGNFQHFLTELFPKLVDYLEVRRESNECVPLLIPKNVYNNFVKEILELLDLDDNLILLDRNTVYEVESLYSSSYVPNFHQIHPKLIAAFKLLRAKVLALPSEPNPKNNDRLYLARDTEACPAQNNNNAGSHRIIINEEEIIKMLRSKGFSSCALGRSSISEKKTRLMGSNMIVSPIGANLFNLLFLSPPYPHTVVIVHSNTFNTHHYYSDVFNQVYGEAIKFKSFEGQSLSAEVNGPFEISPETFSRALEAWLIDH